MCLVIVCELLEDNNHHGHVVTANAAASRVFCQAMVAHTLRDVPYALTLYKPLSDKVNSLQATHKHWLKTSRLRSHLKSALHQTNGFKVAKQATH